VFIHFSSNTQLVELLVAYAHRETNSGVYLQGASGGGFDWMKRFDEDLKRKGVVLWLSTIINH